MQTTPDVLDAIRTHGAEGYPEEVCGLLLGNVHDGTNVVTAIHRVDNEEDANRERRYLIPPDAFRDAQQSARGEGRDIVGIYHSHPDHPAEPSETDLEQATFPGYTYVIVSVHEGTPQDLTAWHLVRDRSRFNQQPIDTEDTASR